MNNLSDNIRRVMIIFLVVFFVLISYLSYFTLFKAPTIVNRPDNKRMWDIRNSVVRGTIYDKDGTVLSQTKVSADNKQKRVYNGSTATAHVLGFCDIQYGITGLENLYDSHLSNNKAASFSAWVQNKFKKVEKKGDDVYTSLDYDLQKVAYDALGSSIGSVVALDIKTGQILAMVSKPSFDPNKLRTNWANLNSNKDRPLLNRAVSGLYPPGSSFKIVTTTSALENINNITKESFNDTGKLNLGGGYALNNDSGKAHGRINLEKALVMSSNVFFGDLGIRLGSDLYKTAEDFMFNKSIPADGIIIDKSRFPSYKSYEKGNRAQTGIGQAEILSTPIQMALVAQAVANDGIMLKPSLISKVKDYNGDIVSEYKAEKLATVTSPQYSAEIRRYLRDAVAIGTGRNAKVSGIEVCGKTGTAQHAESKDPHSWFVGFAPYKNPQIAFAVIVEEGGYGGKAAAKIASKVLTQYFNGSK